MYDKENMPKPIKMALKLLNKIKPQKSFFLMQNPIGVGKQPPLPPNRTCDSLAYGSPVDSFLIGIDTLKPKLYD